MSINKLYLNKLEQEIEEIERRYEFIPPSTNKNSISKICFQTTLEIASARNKNIDSSKLEKNLYEYRKYNIKLSNI